MVLLTVSHGSNWEAKLGLFCSPDYPNYRRMMGGWCRLFCQTVLTFSFVLFFYWNGKLGRWALTAWGHVLKGFLINKQPSMCGRCLTATKMHSRAFRKQKCMIFFPLKKKKRYLTQQRQFLLFNVSRCSCLHTNSCEVCFEKCEKVLPFCFYHIEWHWIVFANLNLPNDDLNDEPKPSTRASWVGPFAVIVCSLLLFNWVNLSTHQ